MDENPWLAARFKAAYSGSSGIVTLVGGYSPFLPHIGSSSSVVDFRPSKRTLKLVRPEATAGFRKAMALSIEEQMQELLAALSLNKTELAKILRVTRPTMCEWFRGKAPNLANAERLRALLAVLSRASVSGANPLNARFVRQPIELGAPSLIDLLSEKYLNEERVLHTIQRVQGLAPLLLSDGAAGKPSRKAASTEAACRSDCLCSASAVQEDPQNRLRLVSEGPAGSFASNGKALQ
jgi:transcriptional regulator with XRE-family HTH domain